MVRPKYACQYCDKLYHADKLFKTNREGIAKVLCKICLKATEPTDQIQEKIYSVNEAHKLLGCSYQFVRELIREGKLVHTWNITHNTIKIKEKDLLELKKSLESNTL